MEVLTDRQREVYDFVAAHTARHGRPPTVREVGDALGISSPNGVAQHLDALARKGWIERQRRSARGVRLVGQAPRAVQAGAGRIAVAGRLVMSRHEARELARQLLELAGGGGGKSA